MRIAMFSDSFYPELGGIQDSVLTSARELGVRGHNMIIFAPAAARRDYVRANVPIAEVSLGRNVKIRRITSLPFPSSTLQSRLVIPTGRRWRDLAQFQPDIIHTHTFLGAGLEALIAARQLQVPLVGTNHWAVGEFSIYAPVGKAAFRRMSTKAVARYYN